jgi:hypothetical protein
MHGLRPPLSPPDGEKMEEIKAKIVLYKKRRLVELLMKGDLMLIWKIKCLDLV